MEKDKYSVTVDGVKNAPVDSIHPHNDGINFVSDDKLYLLQRTHSLFTELYALLLTAASSGGVRVWFRDGTQNSKPIRVVSGIAWDKEHGR